MVVARSTCIAITTVVFVVVAVIVVVVTTVVSTTGSGSANVSSSEGTGTCSIVDGTLQLSNMPADVRCVIQNDGTQTVLGSSGSITVDGSSSDDSITLCSNTDCTSCTSTMSCAVTTSTSSPADAVDTALTGATGATGATGSTGSTGATGATGGSGSGGSATFVMVHRGSHAWNGESVDSDDNLKPSWTVQEDSVTEPEVSENSIISVSVDHPDAQCYVADINEGSYFNVKCTCPSDASDCLSGATLAYAIIS